MNRRNFLASLVALPAGLVAAAKAYAAAPALPIGAGEYVAYVSYGSIPELLEACGKTVSPGPIDLNHIFEQLYRIRSNRDEFIHTLRAA